MAKPQIATEKYKELKKETSRMASMATKRLRRLERNELTDLPAYQSWVDGGSIAFSVAGKDYNELQAEFWRLKNFLDNKTSLVRSANKVLREMADNTGIKYNGLADLKSKTKQFFELASMIKQYYQSADESAIALDYQKIWVQINTQIQQGIITIGEEESTEVILDKYLDALNELVKVEEKQEGFKDVSSEWDFIKI